MRCLQDLRFRVCSNIPLLAANLCSSDSVLLPYMASRQIPRQAGRQEVTCLTSANFCLYSFVPKSAGYEMLGEGGWKRVGGVHTVYDTKLR